MEKTILYFTQKMADDLNRIQDETFTKEEQKLLNIKRYKPCRAGVLIG